MRYYNVANILAPILVNAPKMLGKEQHLRYVLNSFSEAAETLKDSVNLFSFIEKYGDAIYEPISMLVLHGYTVPEATLIVAFEWFVEDLQNYIFSWRAESVERELYLFNRMLDNEIMYRKEDIFTLLMVAIRDLKKSYAASDFSYYAPDAEFTTVINWYLTHEPIHLEQYGRTLEEQVIIKIVLDGIEPTDIPRHLINEIKNNVFLVWS